VKIKTVSLLVSFDKLMKCLRLYGSTGGKKQLYLRYLRHSAEWFELEINRYIDPPILSADI